MQGILKAGINSQVRYGALFLRLVCHMQHLLGCGREALTLCSVCAGFCQSTPPTEPSGLAGHCEGLMLQDF